MFVYLSSDGKMTQIDCADAPANCTIQKSWDVLMALEVPKHLVTKIITRWKRESRGPESRVSKGLNLAKQFVLRVHVSSVPVGQLKELSKFKAEVDGAPKPVPDLFWEKV